MYIVLCIGSCSIDSPASRTLSGESGLRDYSIELCCIRPRVSGYRVHLQFCLQNFLCVGLTYFLTAVQREDDSSLISAYLLQYPSCEHILAPLQWERDRQTYDAVSVVVKIWRAHR